MQPVLRMLIVFVFPVLLCGCGVSPALRSERSRFEARAPSAQEEARFLWELLGRLGFFREHGYRLALPNNAAFEGYLRKAEQGGLPKGGFDDFAAMFRSDIFKATDYEAGLKKVQASLERADRAIPVFEAYQMKWGFYIPRKYLVRLTLYGPGGSYDPRSGTIIMQTGVEGSFKRGSDPLDTIIHEAVHIGMENGIVKRYRLPHWEKERLVDRFVEHHFRELLPEYRMQSMPVSKIDSVLDHPAAWDALPERMEAIY